VEFNLFKKLFSLICLGATKQKRSVSLI